MKKITIGMVGAGFAARLHGNAFREIGGFDLRFKTVTDVNAEAAQKIAAAYGYENHGVDISLILDDAEIDVVFICTPPSLHTDMVLAALQAGKHVVCEKPLTGYFGLPGDAAPIGQKIPKRAMYYHVIKELARMEQALAQSGKLFCYAENYIYSPNIQKAKEFIQAKGSVILFLRGEEAVRGSISAFANSWENIGGGTLLRIGCHPLAGVMYLKHAEAAARGYELQVESVSCDTGRLLDNLSAAERRYLRPELLDVEDFAALTLTFNDGSKAAVFANDNVLGGVKNQVEIFCNDGTLLANITPTDDLSTYYLDQQGIEDVYLSENLPYKTGWNRAFVSESVHRGYVDQLKDFISCVAGGHQPQSGFKEAREICELIYAAYISAEEGRRVNLAELRQSAGA